MVDARATVFEVTPPPQAGGPDALRNWCRTEFERIALVLKTGRSQFVTLDVLNAVPDKVFTGMVGYFAAGIVGASEGLYEYRSTGTWNKL